MVSDIQIKYDALEEHLNFLLKILSYDKSKCKLNYHRECTQKEAEWHVSADALAACKEYKLDKANSYNIIYFDHFEYRQLDSIMGDLGVRLNMPKNYGNSNKVWYPENGYMGWHTNSDAPGYRLYCVHAREGNKSFFRWLDPETNEINTSWEKQGWNFRLFNVNKKRDLWHCVYSATDRISIGYRYYDIQ